MALDSLVPHLATTKSQQPLNTCDAFQIELELHFELIFAEALSPTVLSLTLA